MGNRSGLYRKLKLDRFSSAKVAVVTKEKPASLSYTPLAGFTSHRKQWSGVREIRTPPGLLAALKAFFKDNPGWE
jgi:hypothetical protein